jgi:hypothetical protein
MPNSLLSHTPKWRKRQIGVKSSEKAPFTMRTYSYRGAGIVAKQLSQLPLPG